MFSTLKILLNARLAKMEERGASAVEYGLVVFAIAGVVVAAVFAFGAVTADLFATSCTTIRSAATSVSASCS